MSDDRLLLDVESAAYRLGCKRSYLYTLLKGGELPSVKMGRKRLISVAALEEYVEGLVREGRRNE